MRAQVPGEFLQRDRKIGGTATIAQDRVHYTDNPIPEYFDFGLEIGSFAHYDAASEKNNVLETATSELVHRFGLEASAAQIFKSDLTIITWPGDFSYARQTWVPFANLPDHVGLDPQDCALACVGNPGFSSGATVFCAQYGKIYRWEGGNWYENHWTQLADLKNTALNVIPKVSLSAISTTRLAITAVYSDPNGGIEDHTELYVWDNGTLDKWQGYLPRANTQRNITAITYNNIDYIYVDDYSSKRPVYIKRYGTGCWSATKPILPTDALDDDSTFSIGYASLLGSWYTPVCSGGLYNPSFGVYAVLTGTIKRKYGPAYAVALLGPEQFSLGRDAIFSVNDTRRYKLHQKQYGFQALTLGRISNIGRGLFTAPPVPDQTNSLIGVGNTNIFGFQMDTALNQPNRLNLEIDQNGYENNAPKPGDIVALKVAANGKYFNLGKFGIDNISKLEEETGTRYLLDCTSWALKRMIDWESDAYYDYLSQGEVHGDPGDLTKVIRANGSFDKDLAGGAKVTSWNEDGILYTVPAASHGNFTSCQFQGLTFSNDVWVGVGANYGQETLAETAERLGKKIEDVKAEERMSYGIFAVYRGRHPGDSSHGRMSLVSYNSIRVDSAGVPRPWLELTSVPWTILTGNLFIAIQYQDGYARVYSDPSSDDPLLQLVISSDVTVKADIKNTEHDNYGRGAIFLRIDSGFESAFPFPSDGDVVPFHTLTDKYKKWGYPISGDTTWKWPSSGELKVDSERIKYKGVAGRDKWTDDLYVLPGKVIAKTVDIPLPIPEGGEVIFAQNRTNNYLCQEFTVPSASSILAVRFWARKVNFPEDGLEITIFSGPKTPLGTQVASGAYVGGSTLKDDGGWVMAYFPSPVALSPGTQYRFVIWRSKNHTHPDSTTWFASTTTAGPADTLHTFQEDNDVWHDISGVLPFQAYGKIEGINKEYAIAVKYETGKGLPTDPATSQYYHSNMALCVTKGGGYGQALRIARSYRYTDTLNDLYVIDLEKDPGKIWDQDSMARLAAAFYGLNRGWNGTKSDSTQAAAHGDQVKIHRFVTEPTTSFVARSFEHYSADEDLTLAEVAGELAHKAQVPYVDLANKAASEIGWDDPNLWPVIPAQSKSLIATVTLGDFLKNEQWLEIYLQNRNIAVGNGYLNVFRAYVYAWHDAASNKDLVTLYVFSYPNDKTDRNVYRDIRVRFEAPLTGELRFSLTDGHFAMWAGGRLVGATQIENTFADAEHQWTHVQFCLHHTEGQTPYPDLKTARLFIPQAGTRVDNFALDMGKSGTQLLTQLIGEKRVYFAEDVWGTPRIFTERTIVESQVYTWATSAKTQTSDTALATRLLVEGGEVVEVTNAANLSDFGNLFRSVNVTEVNTLDDAQYYASLILEDMALNLKPIELTGPADVTFEPGDIIYVTTAGGVTRNIVVDAISYTMRADENDAVFDMRLSGREITNEEAG